MSATSAALRNQRRLYEHKFKAASIFSAYFRSRSRSSKQAQAQIYCRPLSRMREEIVAFLLISVLSPQQHPDKTSVSSQSENKDGGGGGGEYTKSQTEKGSCVFVYGNRKWWLYLKLGAEAHSRAKQARSTAAYTSRKKMVTMLAMVLSFPEKRTSWRQTGKVNRDKCTDNGGNDCRICFWSKCHQRDTLALEGILVLEDGEGEEVGRGAGDEK